MTVETAGCFRPDCRFAPALKLTGSGSLEIDSWCSDACRELTVAGVELSRCEMTPALHRYARRLDLIAQLLDLRENAGEVVFTTTPTPVLTTPTDATEAVGG